MICSCAPMFKFFYTPPDGASTENQISNREFSDFLRTYYCDFLSNVYRQARFFSVVIMGNDKQVLPVLHWLEVVIAFVSSTNILSCLWKLPSHLPQYTAIYYYVCWYKQVCVTFGLVMTSMVSSASLMCGGMWVQTRNCSHDWAPANMSPPPTTTIQLYIRFFISSESDPHHMHNNAIVIQKTLVSAGCS